MCAAKDRAIALPLSCRLGADVLALSRSRPCAGLNREPVCGLAAFQQFVDLV